MDECMKIAVLPGDGVGGEVTREAVETLEWLGAHRGLPFACVHADVGGAALEKGLPPLPDATRTLCGESDAVLFGAIGDPRWDALAPSERPESALLELRSLLGTYANLRPARYYASLADTCPLRRRVADGADLLIVRELGGGIYFGEPRGVRTTGSGERVAVNTMTYTASEVRRVARVAFEAAGKRSGLVTSVDKMNVLEVSRLWRDVVDDVGREYPAVRLEHRLVDSFALDLVLKPAQFDVVLTANMFGDILSDAAAALSGSLGMLPSASLGSGPHLYEPVHGSAPDIAGLDRANPCGALLSVAMMLRHSFALEFEAASLENAVVDVLDAGVRTADLAASGGEVVSTRSFGDAVRRALAHRVDHAPRSCDAMT